MMASSTSSISAEIINSNARTADGECIRATSISNSCNEGNIATIENCDSDVIVDKDSINQHSLDLLLCIDPQTHLHQQHNHQCLLKHANGAATDDCFTDNADCSNRVNSSLLITTSSSSPNDCFPDLHQHKNKESYQAKLLHQPPTTTALREPCVGGSGCPSLCTACCKPQTTAAQRVPSSEINAVGQCLTCSSLLCRSCVFAHKFMLCFQGHKVVPFPSTITTNVIVPELNRDDLNDDNNNNKSTKNLSTSPTRDFNLSEDKPPHDTDTNPKSQGCKLSKNHCPNEVSKALSEIPIPILTAASPSTLFHNQECLISHFDHALTLSNRKSLDNSIANPENLPEIENHENIGQSKTSNYLNRNETFQENVRMNSTDRGGFKNPHQHCSAVMDPNGQLYNLFTNLYLNYSTKNNNKDEMPSSQNMPSPSSTDDVIHSMSYSQHPKSVSLSETEEKPRRSSSQSDSMMSLHQASFTAHPHHLKMDVTAIAVTPDPSSIQFCPKSECGECKSSTYINNNITRFGHNAPGLSVGLKNERTINPDDHTTSSSNRHQCIRSTSDLLVQLERCKNAIQVQHWRTSLKVNEVFEYFKDVLCQHHQLLMKILDDAFETERRLLTDALTEVRSNGAFQQYSSMGDFFRTFDGLMNQKLALFDFTTDPLLIRKAVVDGFGQLRIRKLQDSGGEAERSVLPWGSSSSDSLSLSSGYGSSSLSGNNGSQMSFLFPSSVGSQSVPQEYSNTTILTKTRNSSYHNSCNLISNDAPIPDTPADSRSVTTSTGSTSTTNNTIRSDPLYSHQWPLISGEAECGGWLQDSCWNNSTTSNDQYSLFPRTLSSSCQLHSPNDVIRKLNSRITDLIEPAALGCSNNRTSSLTTTEFDDLAQPLHSPTGITNRYCDLAACSAAATSHLCEQLLSVSGCPCANRPLSSIRRQKMVYHCKFGEFGGLDGQFTEPSGVAVNLQSDIIVADTNNHRIQVFDQDGHYKFRFGECGKRDGQLLYPNRVAVFKLSGDIVVTERSPTHQVQIFNQNGTFVRKFGSTVLQHPRGVCVDPSGNIIVAECKVMRVFVFDRFGNAISRFNCSKHLEFPNSVCANDKQEIFISDNRAHCVKVFSYDGRLIRTLGGEGITNFPIGVGLDASGNVLVADNHNNFNLTMFSQTGHLLAALESKVKHAQCFDAAIMDSSGSVVLSSKDYHIYVYRYVPVTFFSGNRSAVGIHNVDIVRGAVSSDHPHC